MKDDLSQLPSPRVFEDMIAQLLALELPTANVIRANPGDGGIDVLAGKLTAAFVAYQVKYFCGSIGDSQKAQIRGSLKTVSVRKPERWVLVTATTFDEPTQRWFEKHVAQYAFLCEHWDAARVQALLNRHFGVRRAYFVDPNEEAMRTIAMALGGTARLHDYARPELLKHMVEANELLDANNPDWGWERSIDRDGALTMTPYPRHPAAVGRIDIHLQIPANDPEGRRVAAGWQDLLKKGRPLEVPGRFVNQFVTHFGVEEVMCGCDLRIAPYIGMPPVPSRFEFIGVNGSTVELPYVQLRCVELGSEQFRLSNEEQASAGNISLVIKSDRSGKVRFSLTINSAGHRAREVLPYQRLRHALYEGGELVIQALEADTQLIKLGVPARTAPEGDTSWLSFLQDVSRIEQAFGVALPLPDEIEMEDGRSIEQLAGIIDSGGFEIATTAVTLTGTGATAASIIDSLETRTQGMGLFITFDREDMVVFGVPVPTGRSQMVIRDPLLLNDSAELRRWAAGDRDEQHEFIISPPSGSALIRYKGWPRTGESELLKGLAPW